MIACGACGLTLCDYSLHAVASRPAEIAGTLILAEFRGTTTRLRVSA
jgi:hypothetical protein